MTERLRDLADRLSAVLEEETALLEALDLSAAGGLLARKRAAVAALQAALAAIPAPEASATDFPTTDFSATGFSATGLARTPATDLARTPATDRARTPATDLTQAPGADAALRDSVRRMATLAAANRAAVERGLALQTRLIETIARAVPRARAQEAPTYQSDGGKLPPRPPQPYAFLSRM